MEYGIGLDIGIASVGWALVGLDALGSPWGILKMGSRIFDKAEQPKTGESLAAPRRMARGMRRRLRRKALRREDIYALFAKNGLPDHAQMAALFQAGGLEDIYALRTRALDECVSREDFCRILLHLSQRRGFKSNRKADAADADAGRLLSAVDGNRQCMESHHYRTVGEMLYKDERFAQHKRNKASEYLSTVGRDMIAQEAGLIFAAQRDKGAVWATPELEAEYLTILLRQRNFDEGPGGNSPYAGNQIEKMIGWCTLETDPPQPRAAKASYSFEYFTLLQKLAHIRLDEHGTTRPLSRAEMDEAVSLCLSAADVSYARLRKHLGLADDTLFRDVRPRRGESAADAEKKQKLNCLRAYHTERKALDSVKKNRIAELTIDQRDAIGEAFSRYKNDDRIRACLQEAGLTSYDIDALLSITNFSGFGHISAKACRRLAPFLAQGMTYNAACDAAGYHFKGHEGGERSLYLPANSPEMEDITSPVVRRAISQTIKVVNAIIREQNASPSYIHIELARELSKTFSERSEMDKSMKDNAAANERLMQELRENFHRASPSGLDLVKYRLWKEQDGRCVYSQKPIALERLFEPGYTDIDHIIPYSISFDDTRANKVLVLSEENRQKGNRLPLQYLQGERRDAFIVWVNSQFHTSYRKRQNLLKEVLTEDDQQGFRQRNLQDTQHMAVFLYNYLSDHLAFSDFPKDKKQRVFAVSGAVTSHLRKRWGLTKVRADGDMHHAMDAVVIACTTARMTQQISGYYGHIEGQYLPSADGSHVVHSRTKEEFPLPWPNFRQELIQRMSSSPADELMRWNPDFYRIYGTESVRPVFVSRMPQHKVTGAAHKATVQGARYLNDGIVTIRQPLTALKLDASGELQDYFMPSSDTLLYEALKKRLHEYGGNAQKAFAEPFFKPKADGTQGPPVHKVTLVKKSTLSVPVLGGAGAADNDTMVRIDIFHIDGDGYYMIPIYVADTRKPQLPNRAVIAFRPYSEWKEMQEKDFLFSLYPNDLIGITSRKENGLKFTVQNADSTLEKNYICTQALAYYNSANIAIGTIFIRTHDAAYGIASLGIKTLRQLCKYQVDVLGNVSPVRRETRQTFR